MAMKEFKTEFFDWIRDHASDDVAKLRLKYGKEYGGAITQIECRRKFGKKLEQTLTSFPDFYFPSVLAGEQSTSDLLAEFHSSLTPEGLAVADLTAGLGIDALHAASRAASVVAVERDENKAEALRFNAAALKADNLSVVCADCRDFVEECIASGRSFDTVFIDPARRSADGGRVFALSDCEPDVVAMLPKLAKICRMLIIKASPMLDVSHTIAAVSPAPEAVMAVGTMTDCKELLVTVVFNPETQAPTLIESVTLHPDHSATTFSFTAEEERSAPVPPVAENFAEGDFICEPNPELMKTGAFKVVARRWNLSMFHPNTRVFASKVCPEMFPGACYRVLKVLPYASRVIKGFAKDYPVINVAARNFGMSADALRMKLKVRDGGSLRLYGITCAKGEKMLVVCSPE